MIKTLSLILGKKRNQGKFSKENLNKEVAKDCTLNNDNDEVQLEVRIIEKVLNNTWIFTWFGINL